MNAIMSLALNWALSYVQSPAGQQALVAMLPTIANAAKGVVQRLVEGQSQGLSVDEQKAALLSHITDQISAAAAKAEVEHAAHPNDDSAFDPGVFRD